MTARALIVKIIQNDALDRTTHDVHRITDCIDAQLKSKPDS